MVIISILDILHDIYVIMKQNENDGGEVLISNIINVKYTTQVSKCMALKNSLIFKW